MYRYDTPREHPRDRDNRISISKLFIGGLLFVASYLVLVGVTV